MTPAQRHDLDVTIAAIAQRHGEDLADLITTRAIETGGFFKPADPDNTWDSQRVEITLHGVFAEGADLAEAARNWLRAARWTTGQQLTEGDAA